MTSNGVLISFRGPVSEMMQWCPWSRNEVPDFPPRAVKYRPAKTFLRAIMMLQRNRSTLRNPAEQRRAARRQEREMQEIVETRPN